MLLRSLLLGLVACVAATASPDASSSDLETRSSGVKTFWYEEIDHNGISPFIENGESWTVFRNVKDFGAKGDGVTDDSAAITNALNYANGTLIRGPSSYNTYGTTGAPAVVYFPAGTYLIKSPIQSWVYNVIMGDPINRPTIKADANWNTSFVWYAKQNNLDATINFYIGLKNLIFDTTAIPGSQNVSILDWSISQAVQLTNVLFNMAPGGTGHGAIMMPEGGSPLEINDCVFQGGSFGIAMNAQQYQLKGLTFQNMDIGLRMDKLFEGSCIGMTFENCRVGIDTSNGNTGFLAVIDSYATNTEIVINAATINQTQGSLVLENIVVDGSVESTVSIANKTVVRGSISGNQAWIYGNAYRAGESTNQARFDPPQTITVNRPSVLTPTPGRTFFTMPPPTYQEYSVDQVINVKNVPFLTVHGDGETDDTVALQAVINLAALENKVLFMPHGTYIVSETILIPPNTRIVGEVVSEISARGPRFKNPAFPAPMVQVGLPGEIGVAQFSDIVFTLAEILPGCVLVEVNMAGWQPGDVGFFNSHVRIGGAPGSTIFDGCDDPKTCPAARLGVHLTETSSAYIDNSWIWNSDHKLDSTTGGQHPSTAGGILVEATRGTWLVGIASEHSNLYQMSIYGAANVFLGFQQSETAYWQGNGSDIMPPAPWQDVLMPGEPDFSWCAADDAECRMGLYQYISQSSNIFAYGGGFWTFFNNLTGCAGNCQDNAAFMNNNGDDVYVFGISTHNSKNLILESQGGLQYAQIAPQEENSGGWESGGGVVAAWLPSEQGGGWW